MLPSNKGARTRRSLIRCSIDFCTHFPLLQEQNCARHNGSHTLYGLYNKKCVVARVHGAFTPTLIIRIKKPDVMSGFRGAWVPMQQHQQAQRYFRRMKNTDAYASYGVVYAYTHHRVEACERVSRLLHHFARQRIVLWVVAFHPIEVGESY